jgi:2-polyprenyl-3-methyl-5-hydroxy-6-metoxy-1,4-benzoquinol methylase
MRSCCSQGSGDQGRYGRFFNERFARRIARKYRKRGLDGTSRRIADFLDSRGLEGATVLEIGGGVGEIQVELLKAGAARSVNLELSPEYDAEARRLAEENAVGDRVDRRLHDIAADPEAVEPADVVVLHRVVCCYPDYERLLGAAADHAQRLLVFSYPPRSPLTRALVTVLNALQALRRSDFRSFTHPPEAMLAVLDRRGLRRTYEHHGLVWQIAGLERG